MGQPMISDKEWFLGQARNLLDQQGKHGVVILRGPWSKDMHILHVLPGRTEAEHMDMSRNFIISEGGNHKHPVTSAKR
jgi:hypothetical protein